VELRGGLLLLHLNYFFIDGTVRFRLKKPEAAEAKKLIEVS
jgi:hypothetical protein